MRKKKKKKVKLAIGAITKGLAKNTNGKEDNTVADSTPTKNVAAWHNTPHACVSLSRQCLIVFKQFLKIVYEFFLNIDLKA